MITFNSALESLENSKNGSFERYLEQLRYFRLVCTTDFWNEWVAYAVRHRQTRLLIPMAVEKYYGDEKWTQAPVFSHDGIIVETSNDCLVAYDGNKLCRVHFDATAYNDDNVFPVTISGLDGVSEKVVTAVELFLPVITAIKLI